LGRKNWVVSGSPSGAKSSCELYSLIETAKANGLNPFDYLNKVFALAAEMTDDSDWSRLLPWNTKLSLLRKVSHGDRQISNKIVNLKHVQEKRHGKNERAMERGRMAFKRAKP
jgi:hypothetical protein